MAHCESLTLTLNNSHGIEMRGCVLIVYRDGQRLGQDGARPVGKGDGLQFRVHAPGMTHWRWIAAVDYSDEPENSDVVVMDTGLRTIDKCDYSITAHDPSAKFTVSETFRRASPIARKRETTNTIRFSGPKALEPADNWDVVQELYFEGSHGQLGGWHSEKWEFINEHPGGRIEHAEVELHRDNDAKWELQMPAPNRIVYTLSAASCLFSCDEVRVRVYIRFVG